MSVNIVDLAVIARTSGASVPWRAGNSHEVVEETLDVYDGSCEELLEELEPFLREAYVVKPPGAPGQMPILSGAPSRSRPLLPEDLTPIPSSRWTVTPRIEAAHRHNVESGQVTGDNSELTGFIKPLLESRYAHRRDMNVVELGPATSTVVPTVLKDKTARHFAMELSVPYLEYQRGLVPGAIPVLGNTFEMPFNDGVADLVFVSCHPPFVSASPADQIQALAEVERVLAPEGEFVLFPWYADEKDPRVNDWLDQRFEVLERATAPMGGGRELLVLKKRS